MRMSSSISSLLPDPKELKFLCVAGFYLFSNFILFYLPPVAYLAWHGNPLCRLLCLITLVDYLCPLRLPSLWLWWCRFTNDVAGKTSYFDRSDKVRALTRVYSNSRVFSRYTAADL